MWATPSSSSSRRTMSDSPAAINAATTCLKLCGRCSAHINLRRAKITTLPSTVTWQDGRVTDSRVKWYGKGTRSEYRLTRFGKDFPFLTFDNVGDLLVLIPETHQEFSAFVLDHDTDIEEMEAALGVQIIKTWACFLNGVPQEETEEECIERRFRKFTENLPTFPPGQVFSELTWNAIKECVRDMEKLTADKLLMSCMEAEYRLFRLAERQICQPDIVRVFRDVDDFIETAARIMNRRKSRAGRSLENHVGYVLRRAGIPYSGCDLRWTANPTSLYRARKNIETHPIRQRSSWLWESKQPAKTGGGRFLTRASAFRKSISSQLSRAFPGTN